MAFTVLIEKFQAANDDFFCGLHESRRLSASRLRVCLCVDLKESSMLAKAENQD